MSGRPRIGELFAGYGGLGHLALAPLIGGRVAWCSEYEPPSKNNPKPNQAAARILAHHYPDVKNHGDITTIDWSTVEPVDWLCGGFPCTDVSVAGAQAGMIAGTRSGLWSEFARAIAALRPTYVLIENVEGLRSARADSNVEPCPWCLGDNADEPHLRALGAVLGDLAALGFDAEWISVRASDTGAPHRRSRVFIVAVNRGARLRDADRLAGSTPAAQRWGSVHLDGSPTLERAVRSGGGDVPDTTGVGRGEGRPEPTRGVGGPAPVLGGGCPTCGCTAAHPHIEGPQGHRGSLTDADQLDPAPGGAGPVPHPEGSRRSGGGLPPDPDPEHGQPGDTGDPVVNWGIYGPAIRRWERTLGRTAPAPTELSKKDQPVLSAAFTEFLMGLPAGHVTSVPGISRADQLKALGNGVVPLQAQLALNMLLPLLHEGTGAGAR